MLVWVHGHPPRALVPRHCLLVGEAHPLQGLPWRARVEALVAAASIGDRGVHVAVGVADGEAWEVSRGGRIVVRPHLVKRQPRESDVLADVVSDMEVHLHEVVRPAAVDDDAGGDGVVGRHGVVGGVGQARPGRPDGAVQ